MDDATPGPQRMRYSFESRCRAVAAMVGGMSPGAAAQAVGASRATGYRWWRRYVTAGWAGLQERPSTPIGTSPGASTRPRRGRSWPRARAVARGRSPSGRCWGAPPRPWARCCGGWGTPAARALPGPRSCAMSAPSRGSCCTSTPRSWAASGTSASASPATAFGAARAPAGSTCTWPSTTTRGWPTPRCGPVTARATPWPSWSARGPGSAPRASRCRR